MVAAQKEQNQLMTTTTSIKGKRTKRPRQTSPLPLALTISTATTSSPSNSAADEAGALAATSTSTTTATNSRDCGVQVSSVTEATEEEEDMANCLILLAQGTTAARNNNNNNKALKLSHHQHQHQPPSPALTTPIPRTTAAAGGEVYAYECKTCNRCFPSFQALGGHRASHKKPKTLAASEEKKGGVSLGEQQHQSSFQLSSDADDSIEAGAAGLSLQIASNPASNTWLCASKTNSNILKPKVHECTICGAEFSSGQALGGHMRRHRPLISACGSSAAQPKAPAPAPRNMLCLDLNLPAADPEEELSQQQQQEAKFVFSSNEKTLVFSASSLVDCHY